MEWLFVLLIIAWYISTGIREGMQWNKEIEYFGNYNKKEWFNITNGIFILTSFLILPSNSLWLKLFLMFMFFVYCLLTDTIRHKDEIDLNIFTIDYHGERAIEGLLYFSLFLIGGMSFWNLSAWWIIGNWIYKRFMNKVMYNKWYKISDMKTFWLFGYPLPYSDYYYDFSLILPVLYFIGINL